MSLIESIADETNPFHLLLNVQIVPCWTTLALSVIQSAGVEVLPLCVLSVKGIF